MYSCRPSQTVITSRANDKNQKHLPGAVDAGCIFLPLVLTTAGGIGPPETIEYLDSLFADSYANELLSSGTSHLTSARRSLFFSSLLTILTRSCADMAHEFSHASSRFLATLPPPPPD